MIENPRPDSNFDHGNTSEEEWTEWFECTEMMIEEMNISLGDYFREKRHDVAYEIVSIDIDTAKIIVRISYSGQKIPIDVFELYEDWRKGDIIPVEQYSDEIS